MIIAMMAMAEAIPPNTYLSTNSVNRDSMNITMLIANITSAEMKMALDFSMVQSLLTMVKTTPSDADRIYTLHADIWNMATRSSRPILIGLLAILYFLTGLLCIIGGILLLIGGVIDVSDESVKNLVDYGGIPLIVTGVLSLIIAGGLWNGWKIMWYLGVIFEIIGIIGCVGMIVTGMIPAIVFLIIALLILYYLFRPGVKSFFGV